jgi:predicted RNA binding protein YcfA (HicA-like mRNA interferase family)
MPGRGRDDEALSCFATAVIFIARLKQGRFEQVSVRGSHHKFVHKALRRMVIMPHPRNDIPARDRAFPPSRK